MDIIIKINTSNAAFEDCGTGPEVARILKQIAEDIDFCDCLISGGQDLSLQDIYGNKAGSFKTL